MIFKIKISIKIALLFILFFAAAAAQQDTVLNEDTTVVIVETRIDTVYIEKEPAAAEDTTKGIRGIIEEPPPLSEIISITKVFWAIIFIILGFYLIKLITKITDLFAEKSANYRITIKGFVPIIRILGWVLILYVVIAGIFQPPQSTLLAVAASLGIAIGFASQDIFKNIFGGIMILFDRPFQVGDKIEIGKHYGEVVKIGLRSTRIVTPDDSLVSVPNGDVMNQAVSNANSGEPNCQVVAEIYLPITIDTEKVRNIAIETAQTSKYVYLNKPVSVIFLNDVKERRSYFKMRLKAYVLDIRYEFNFKSEMTEIVIRELLKEKLISSEELF
jgi:MscS family membrane protein